MQLIFILILLLLFTVIIIISSRDKSQNTPSQTHTPYFKPSIPPRDSVDYPPQPIPIDPRDFHYQIPLYDNIAVSYPQPPIPRQYAASHRPNPPPSLQRHVRQNDHLLRHLRQLPSGPM
uniref:Uncharacterized protein n=1 Tax=viral metagenome TaxID=1070528 RepID=A0A6C0LWP5_9ZZZZ